MQGTVVFGPSEEVQEIVVKIVDDDMSEPDVQFSINLTAACIDGGDDVTIMRKTTLVTIVDDDDGGVLVFELPTFEVSGNSDSNVLSDNVQISKCVRCIDRYRPIP